MRTTAKKLGFALVAFALSSLAGCGGAGGDGSTAGGGANQTFANHGPLKSGDGGNIDNTGNNGGGDKGSIARFKPALAVRATGCMLCHSQVKSNIITDFGNGDNYFFGFNTPGLAPFSGSVYGNHADNWASAQVWGTIFVPDAPLNYNGAATLKDYLASVVTAPDAQTPKPTVTSQSKIFIGAPTAAKILQVAGTFPSAHPSWKFIGSSVSNPSTPSLIDQGAYLETPSGTMGCDGDLIVNKPLFINNLQLDSIKGCRIYATYGVYVQGPIAYGSSSTANLQITSSRAVILGMGKGPVYIPSAGSSVNSSIEYRLRDHWCAPGFYSRESGTVASKLGTIIDEANAIPNLIDSALQPGGRGVAFSRLLINAPQIHSRYQGQFDGVIIAEVAIWSLGDFAFKYDDVFSNVPVLPLLTEDNFLSITP